MLRSLWCCSGLNFALMESNIWLGYRCRRKRSNKILHTGRRGFSVGRDRTLLKDFPHASGQFYKGEERTSGKQAGLEVSMSAGFGDFQRSPFGKRSRGNAFLLGDAGYPISKNLLTPLKNPTTPEERRYNQFHKADRVTVERTLVILKRRFPLLHGYLRLKLDRIPGFVTTCAILHNVGIYLKDEPSPEADEDEEGVLTMNKSLWEKNRTMQSVHKECRKGMK